MHQAEINAELKRINAEIASVEVELREKTQLTALASAQGSVQVISVTWAKTYPVHDLTVADDASYEAGGIFNHNSASKDPNLQNIPERKSRAKMVKRQFVSQKGRLFCKRDFSAHEVRMAGAAAHDPMVAKSFWNGMQIRLKYEFQREIPKEKKDWWGAQLKAADVHYQNYGVLYNVSPLNVTKAQRDSVKPVIFGSIYGKGMESLGQDLQRGTVDALEKTIENYQKQLTEGNADKRAIQVKLDGTLKERDHENAKDWTAEAKKVSHLIFEVKFKRLGKWIKECEKQGLATCRVTNPLGGVRHLFGYLHPERHVRSAMDRRGPNSAVQGPSSTLGYKGGENTRRLVWEWFESRGVSLGYIQCNAVHDSTVAESPYVNIPLMEYLAHHGFTTMLHRWMRDMGSPLLVGFEMDGKVGACEAHMEDATRWDAMVSAVEKGIIWGNDNLGWNEDVEPIMKIVKHNAQIIHNLRRTEIRNQLEKRLAVNYDMAMTKDNCLKLGLIFKMPEVKRIERVESQAWRRELEDV